MRAANRCPAASRRHPETADHELRTTNYELPTTNYQPPTTMKVFKSIAVAAAGFAAAVMFSAAAPVAQQHGYSADQIAEGRTLYDANCGRCHNNDGAGVPGVELFKQIR